VVLKSGATATEAELIAHTRDRLAHFKAPHTVTFVQELPKTATGKIQRYLLRQKHLNSKSPRAERAAARTPSPSGRESG
jgi:fatty-acyl-CoA synthase